MIIRKIRWYFILFSLISFYAHSAGDAKIGKTKTASCGGCHGITGNSVVPNFPSLAEQPSSYLIKQLKDFRSGKRKSDVMQGMALAIAESDIEHVAEYYSSQKRVEITKNITHLASEKEKTALLTLGKKLYDEGNPDTGQSVCFTCHGKTGNALKGLINIPIIVGQHPQYLIATLKEFKNKIRKNDDERVMRRIAATMSDEEITAVSYYASYLFNNLKEKK